MFFLITVKFLARSMANNFYHRFKYRLDTESLMTLSRGVLGDFAKLFTAWIISIFSSQYRQQIASAKQNKILCGLEKWNLIISHVFEGLIRVEWSWFNLVQWVS